MKSGIWMRTRGESSPGGNYQCKKGVRGLAQTPDLLTACQPYSQNAKAARGQLRDGDTSDVMYR